MADESTRFTTEPIVFRHCSDKYLLPANVATEIVNMEVSEDGVLVPVVRGSYYVPVDEQNIGTTGLVYTEQHPYKVPDELSIIDMGWDVKWHEYYSPTPRQTNFHGIFHARLEKSRHIKDVTLLHAGDGIYVHTGYSKVDGWKKIIQSERPISTATDRSPGELIPDAKLIDTSSPRFPTQFELTDKGIVIAPQGSRAYFYDGEVCLPLGYSQTPSAPIGLGPTTGKAEEPNNEGYNVGRTEQRDEYTLNLDFGFGRIGSVNPWTSDSEFGGELLPGSYQGATQWIDYFGNFSPISQRSNEIRLSGQRRTGKIPDVLLKCCFWREIATGPHGTVARRLLRTRDLINSGTSELFIVPGNVGFGTLSADANLPDNLTNIWSDNTPDSWLVSPSFDPRPVPIFKLCKFALGRLWIANTADHSGEVVPSLPGRYGTFLKGTSIFPDPTGGEITGLWNTAGGLLVFTKSSVFMITPNDSGEGFRASALSTEIGCMGPNTISNLPDGSTVWLGREGFYRLTSQGIMLISKDISKKIKRINWLRAKAACAVTDPKTDEYRCWVAVDGQIRNTFCFVYDGEGWRYRDGSEVYSDLCVTKDDRKLILGAGYYTKYSYDRHRSRFFWPQYPGVFVLDRDFGQGQVLNAVKLRNQPHIETGWIEWGRTEQRRTIKTIYLAVLESAGHFELEIYRDWRKSEKNRVFKESYYPLSPADPPKMATRVGFYPQNDKLKAIVDEDAFQNPRPVWLKIDVDVPSCEAYKIVLTGSASKGGGYGTPSSFSLIGMLIDEEPKPGSFGSRIITPIRMTKEDAATANQLDVSYKLGD